MKRKKVLKPRQKFYLAEIDGKTYRCEGGGPVGDGDRAYLEDVKFIIADPNQDVIGKQVRLRIGFDNVGHEIELFNGVVTDVITDFEHDRVQITAGWKP